MHAHCAKMMLPNDMSKVHCVQYGEAKLTGLCKTRPVNFACPFCTSLITVGDLKINIYPPSIPLPGYCMK